MSAFVVDGTKLQCTMGTEPAELKVSARRSTSIGGKSVATAQDCIPYINIGCFGKCKAIHQGLKPCTPAGTWENTNKKLEVDDAQALTEKSRMVCVCGGGLISIQGAEKKQIKTRRN